jgi:TetR/AcrR family transcriptional regulator, cholesterol catabolism regulator
MAAASRLSRTRGGAALKTRSGVHARERWQRILVAATRLFREKGFSATSMQDVSDEVGLLKGSLYYYIRSKEDLLYAVLKDLHLGGEEIIRRIQFRSGAPLAQLETYLRDLGLHAGRNQDRLAVFLRDFRFVRAHEQREIIRERNMYVTAAEKLIIEARDRGEAERSTDARIAAILLTTAVSSIHEWYREGGALPLDAVAEQAAALLIGGIRMRSSPPARGRRTRSAR